jgi:O-antigen/teichoic acid export membrane protein
MAILLPKENYKAINIVFLSTLIAVSFSILVFFIVLFFKSHLAFLIGEPKIENWLFLVPVSILFIGIYNSLNLYNTREKNFKEVAVSSVYKSLGSATTQCGLGLLSFGPLGLVLGQVISFLSGNYILLKRFTEKVDIKNGFNFATIKQMALRYRKFPQFTLPGNLLNSTNLNLITFLITGIFSVKTLGFYTLAKRTLGVPSVVIGKSISQVYFQKMSSTKNTRGNTLKVFNSTLKKLILISIPLFALLFFVVEPIFTIVYGKDWSIAGEYAKLLIPLIAIRFVSSSLSSTVSIFEKQHISLIINFILIISVCSVFAYSYYYGISFKSSLIIYTLVLGIEYFGFIFLYWWLTKTYVKEES